MSEDPRNSSAFDALLFLSFGGPERVEDVRPFLENVTRGRGVPPERFEDVVQHYLHFGGVSPINRLNLAMIDAVRAELASRGRDLPVYFGNRNWHPMAAVTTRQIYDDGHRRVLVFPTSAWGGYSGCRQYHEDIAAALEASIPGDDPTFLMRKLPQYCGESKFIEASANALRSALAEFDETPRVVFTAHSIPESADRNAGPAADGGHLYSLQVKAASTAVAQKLGIDEFDVVWQSRSGPPHVRWLDPDICDHLRDLHGRGVTNVAVMPIGFISDHLEVIWDLDSEARDVAAELGMSYVRVPTIGTDPVFISLIADLVERHVDGDGDVTALGCGDNGGICRPDCCVPVRRPARTP